jgi:DoxX-like protein
MGNALQVWTGRILSGFAVMFLAFDTVVKLLQLPMAVEGTQQVGYSAGVILPLGLIEAAFLAAYLTPRTAALGAVLWTGYLGGAVATHVRMGDPLFGFTLFPVYMAAILWGGLWLRDARVRTLLRRAYA